MEERNAGTDSPQRRLSDQSRWTRIKYRVKHGPWRLFIRDNAYRDVWLVLTTGIVAVALINSSEAINQQKEGRRAGLDVTCALGSGVIEAGRATISSGAASNKDPHMRRFLKELEKLGYPPRRVRERQAKLAAEAYARQIARVVERASGVKGIVRQNGKLDCEKLRVITKTQ